MNKNKQSVIKVKPKKPKKKRIIFFWMILFIALGFLITRIFIVDIACEVGKAAYQNKQYEQAAKLLKTVYSINPDNKECLYYWAASLSKLPITLENQKDLYKIAQSDNDSAGELLASKILKSYKAKILLKSGDNYIEKALYNDTVLRWNLENLPLKYCIESSAPIPNFYVNSTHNSFKLWQSHSNELLTFSPTENKNEANIIITFSETGDLEKCTGENCEYSVGTTIPKLKGDKLLFMDVKINTKNNLHHYFSQEEISTVLTHEIGHALGIWGHSTNKSSIMYYSADKQYGYTSKNIAPLDTNTLRLLYRLSPTITNQAISQANKDRQIYSPILISSLQNNNNFAIKKSIEFLDKDPHDANRWIELAAAYGENKQYEESIKTLKRALAVATDPELLSIIYYNLSNDYISLHDFENALTCAKKAQQFKDDTETKILIAYVHLKNKKYSLAEKELKVLSEEEPTNIDIATNLADVYIDQKQFLKAREVLKTLMSKNPEAKFDERLSSYKIYTIF